MNTILCLVSSLPSESWPPASPTRLPWQTCFIVLLQPRHPPRTGHLFPAGADVLHHILYRGGVLSWRILRAPKINRFGCIPFCRLGLGLAFSFKFSPRCSISRRLFRRARREDAAFSTCRRNRLCQALNPVAIGAKNILALIRWYRLGTFSQKTHFGRAYRTQPQVWMWMDDFRKNTAPVGNEISEQAAEMALLFERTSPHLPVISPRHTVEMPKSPRVARRHGGGAASFSGKSSPPARFLEKRGAPKKRQQPLAHRPRI